MKIKIVTVTET